MEGTVRQEWPASASTTQELLSTALHLQFPELFSLNSDFPVDATMYADCDALLLPLSFQGEQRGACLLIGGNGFANDDPEVWEVVAEALSLCEQRHTRLASEGDEMKRQRGRAEESEALHTLGLVANRTLQPKGVVGLGARFARYSAVTTSQSA